MNLALGVDQHHQRQPEPGPVVEQIPPENRESGGSIRRRSAQVHDLERHRRRSFRQPAIGQDQKARLGGLGQRHGIHQPGRLEHEAVVGLERLDGLCRNASGRQGSSLGLGRAFANAVAISRRQVLKGLLCSRRPPNGHPAGDLLLAQSEREALGVLGNVPGPGRQRLRAGPAVGLHLDDRPDRVAVGASALQFDHQGLAIPGRLVVEGPQLQPEPTLEHQVRTAIAAEVGHGESPAVSREIEPGDPGKIAVPAAAPSIEDVGLVAVPAKVLADHLIETVPACLVVRHGRCVRSRLRHDPAPEKAAQVLVRRMRDHPGGHENLGGPVQVEVESVAGPRPAPHLHPFPRRAVLERSSA